MLEILAQKAHHPHQSNLSFLKALETEIMMGFSQAMERSSGVYKRQVKWMTRVFGFILAVAVNADTLNLANRLGAEPILRENLVERVALIYEMQNLGMPNREDDSNPLNVDALLRETSLFLSEFSSLPMGGSSSNVNKQLGRLSEINPPESMSVWLALERPRLIQAFLGWILTEIATSMGSSFWFDLLNKIINVRGTGNKPTDPPQMKNL